ncbi:hypothetical protein [Schumannella luteola]
MTIAQPTSGPGATRVGASIQWTVVQAGLWVGKVGGEFAGMIESRGAGFAAIRFAKELGVFPTLGEAKAAFAGV